MIQYASYILTLHLVHNSLASYCGQAAIPFTFQVLHSGLPVLGCARPNCFGWNANGTRADETAQFYRINGKEDGYLRRSDTVARSPYRSQDMTPRVAKCEETYSKQGCTTGQWIGGIAPQSFAESPKLQVRCCWYAPLLESEDRGVAMVTNGQLVVGGEVMDSDTLEGFDYIADIKEEGIKNGRTVYAVSIRRMACTDDDSTPENAALQELDGDVRPKSKAKPSALVSIYDQQVQHGYGAASTPVPGGDALRMASNALEAAPGQITQLAPSQSVAQPTQPQYVAGKVANAVQASGVQTAIPQYSPYYQMPLQQAAHPFGGIYGQQAVPFMTLQQLPLAAQQQSFLQNQGALPTPTTPLPTLPPLTFPTLDQIPKIDIPSVEDVENVIPPVQRAILTTVARFFGVL